MDTAEDFEAQLDANDRDWELRMVYADWLEERGDQELARAQRWMVKHGCYPYGDMQIKCWANFSIGPGDRSKLPNHVWEAVRQQGGHVEREGVVDSIEGSYRYYGTRRQCERVLANALATLGDIE
jgi:uncharacterized protein (TIGR02996 family)